MQSLHPRYPVLKVPAPARLAAAVARGLMMPETGAPGGGNLHLHILYTYGGDGAPFSLLSLLYISAPAIKNAAHASLTGAYAATYAISPLSIYVLAPTAACQTVTFH